MLRPYGCKAEAFETIEASCLVNSAIGPADRTAGLKAGQLAGLCGKNTVEEWRRV